MIELFGKKPAAFALGKTWPPKEGWRVLTAYVSDTVAVLLVTVYGKNQRGNVSKAEVNEMGKLMKELKAEARGSRE